VVGEVGHHRVDCLPRRDALLDCGEDGHRPAAHSVLLLHVVAGAATLAAVTLSAVARTAVRRSLDVRHGEITAARHGTGCMARSLLLLLLLALLAPTAVVLLLAGLRLH